MISILVDEVTVTVSETEILTAGRVGLECSVSFNGGIWGDLVKKITFEGTESKTLVLADSVVTIPYECLAESGYKLRVGVCGENADGTVVVPTLWADIGKIKPAAPREGAEPETPTPSVVAQIQALATSANSNASAALTMIDDMTVAATASSQVYANISDEGTHKHIEFGIPAMQTVDFDNVTNRPKYNGTAMTSATNVPEVKTALWDSKAAGNHNHDSRYYTETETDTKLALKANTADLATVATSGDYDDLSNKPTIPVVPTNLSDFTDDLGSTPVHTHSQYLTEHQSLSAYRTSAAQDVIDSSLSSVIANKVSYTDKLSQITGAMTDAEKRNVCSTIGAVPADYTLFADITVEEASRFITIDDVVSRDVIIVITSTTGFGGTPYATHGNSSPFYIGAGNDIKYSYIRLTIESFMTVSRTIVQDYGTGVVFICLPKFTTSSDNKLKLNSNNNDHLFTVGTNIKVYVR